MEQMAAGALVVLVFAGPTSRALFNLSAFVLMCGVVLAGRYRQRWAAAWASPIAAPALLLFTVIVVGMLYSEAPWRDRLEHLRVYSKLPFLLLLVAIWQDAKWRNRTWMAFCAAMALVWAATYLNIVLGLPWSSMDTNLGLPRDRSVLLDYSIQGVVSSIFVGLALDRARSALMPPLQRGLWLGAALMVGLSIVFLLVGKAGLLTLSAVLACFVFWGLPKAWRWVGLAVLVTLLLGLIALAPELSDRFHRALRQLVNPAAQIDFESVGLRWQMWQMSAQVFLESPLWGHGTGAYHSLAAKHLTHCELTCSHPHNQFLFFGVEQGLIGVAAFGYLLYALYRMARQDLAQGSVAMMAFLAVFVVESVLNTPLWYRMESYVFYPLIALFMASAQGRMPAGVQHGTR
jgi:hypothetical protein